MGQTPLAKRGYGKEHDNDQVIYPNEYGGPQGLHNQVGQKVTSEWKSGFERALRHTGYTDKLPDDVSRKEYITKYKAAQAGGRKDLKRWYDGVYTREDNMDIPISFDAKVDGIGEHVNKTANRGHGLPYQREIYSPELIREIRAGKNGSVQVLKGGDPLSAVFGPYSRRTVGKDAPRSDGYQYTFNSADPLQSTVENYSHDQGFLVDKGRQRLNEMGDRDAALQRMMEEERSNAVTAVDFLAESSKPKGPGVMPLWSVFDDERTVASPVDQYVPGGFPYQTTSSVRPFESVLEPKSSLHGRVPLPKSAREKILPAVARSSKSVVMFSPRYDGTDETVRHPVGPPLQFKSVKQPPPGERWGPQRYNDVESDVYFENIAANRDNAGYTFHDGHRFRNRLHRRADPYYVPEHARHVDRYSKNSLNVPMVA